MTTYYYQLLTGYYCHTVTWKATVQKTILQPSSDHIVVDASSRQGLCTPVK